MVDRKPLRIPQPPQDFAFLAAAAPRVTAVGVKAPDVKAEPRRSTPPPPPFAASVGGARPPSVPKAPPARGADRRDQQLTVAVPLRAKGSLVARPKPTDSGTRLSPRASRESTKAVELRSQSLGPVLEWLEKLAGRK